MVLKVATGKEAGGGSDAGRRGVLGQCRPRGRWIWGTIQGSAPNKRISMFQL